MALLEIAVQDIEGIAAAARGGAHRIELCSALSLGGLTPSAGLISAASRSSIPVHLLIRPREGGFEYSDAEYATIYDDVERALALGAHGIVVGATRNGRLHGEHFQKLRAIAGPAKLICHRVFDTLADHESGLQELIDLGVDGVLTSGGASHAADALHELSRLVSLADGRIDIIAGSGITPANASRILETGVHAIHASAKAELTETMPVALGSMSAEGNLTRHVTDAETVRALRDATGQGLMSHP